MLGTHGSTLSPSFKVPLRWSIAPTTLVPFVKTLKPELGFLSFYWNLEWLGTGRVYMYYVIPLIGQFLKNPRTSFWPLTGVLINNFKNCIKKPNLYHWLVLLNLHLRTYPKSLVLPNWVKEFTLNRWFFHDI